MTAPLISIVLPTYNGAGYLRDAINSCLNQTCADWELIIVDDCSSDSTPAIIEDYVRTDHRIRSVRNSANRKLPGSLNVGFGLARGEFLGWTSDDNCYRRSALAEMLRYLEQHPSVDIVYTGFSLIDGNGAVIRPGWAGPLEKLPFGNCVGPCFLYRRAVHQRVGEYAEDMFLAEDYDFWLRASACCEMALLDRDLYLYRWHEQSLTLTQTQNLRVVAERCLARNLPQMSWMNRRLRAQAYGHLAQMAMRHGDRRAALRFLVQPARRDALALVSLDTSTLAYVLLPVSLYGVIQGEGPWKVAYQQYLAKKEIAALVPAGSALILIDQAELDGALFEGRRVVPFLERDGYYWGPPSDDATAVRELRRLQRAGASFVVVAHPAFWWLEYYVELSRYLEANSRCLLRNERFIVFDLWQLVWKEPHLAISDDTAAADGATPLAG